ncbi:MAG: response regulator [Elusimicrobia bacterium]|nr:response regulator [Elusimicrobiota bacterium]
MTERPLHQSPKARIVVVDDDPIMRDLFGAILSDDFEVAFAGDGEEGLDLIKRTVPALAILDVNMPRMHGFELCRRLRAEETLKGTKIMFVSAKSYASDINSAREIGGDEYVVKPFDAKEMLETVKKALGCGA